MERKLAEELVEIIESKHGLGSAHVHENYSGRFMYGEVTTGVFAECDCMGLANALVEALVIGWELPQELQDESVDSLKIDQLGRGYIYY